MMRGRSGFGRFGEEFDDPGSVPDLIERAVERTLDQSGSVEVVHGEDARRLHESGGGLGAFLRYISPQLSTREVSRPPRANGCRSVECVIDDSRTVTHLW